MFNLFINKKYLDNLDKLNKEFENNRPFSHLVFKDFFNKDIIERFTKELLKEEFVKQESDLFCFSQTNDLIHSKNKIIERLYNFLNSKEFKEYLFRITRIKAFDKIDCSGFIYSNGDYLLPHDDRLETRKIAYVLNLSSNFTEKDGGSLDFFEKDKIVKSIIPKFNTLTIFGVEVGKTYHQVSEVINNKKRLSIAGWFNDK